jgi:hypothetical protein
MSPGGGGRRLRTLARKWQQNAGLSCRSFDAADNVRYQRHEQCCGANHECLLWADSRSTRPPVSRVYGGRCRAAPNGRLWSRSMLRCKRSASFLRRICIEIRNCRFQCWHRYPQVHAACAAVLVASGRSKNNDFQGICPLESFGHLTSFQIPHFISSSSHMRNQY